MNAHTIPTDLTDEQLARALFKRAGVGMLDAARLVLEFQHCCGTPQSVLNMDDCLSIIRRGSSRLSPATLPPNFGQAIGQFLDNKRHRRPNTRQELRHYTRRVLRQNPAWQVRELASITNDECRQMLIESFPNIHSRRKARIILHGVFSFCHKRGWVETNPADFAEELPPRERRISPLSLPEVTRLLGTCLQAGFCSCAAAVGIMLWAGIRPAEVARLSWEDVKLRDGIIILHPQHTKTGGARCVNIQPPLAWWLKDLLRHNTSGSLCPRNWKRKWSQLHQSADLVPWVPDVLRHSFASYHAAHYHNFEQLQYEMGHRSLQLLRFRYLATGDISPQQAANFWSPLFWKRVLATPAASPALSA